MRFGSIRTTAVVLGAAAMIAQAGPATAEDPERTGAWRLADSTSPYLRMHTDNPVAWYPWGEEAFQAAQEQNKPLFISIGYYTCHWCHVMERESFTNPEIAEFLNEHFIAIKIDREQRPAIDDAYMRYVRAATGSGGWPMSVFATPEGKPFFGGTYFPPEPKRNLPGFKGLAQKVHQQWSSNESQLREVARRGTRAIRQPVALSGKPSLPADLADRAAEGLAKRFDPMNAGFGTNRKFPQGPNLVFLLGRSDSEQRAMALKSLDAIAAGGIHDQLGGGFHRYAVDPQWHVPHFEKMLYNQALLTRAYLRAYRQTERARYRRIAQRTLAFALSEMRHPDGGFYAALAANTPVPGNPEEEAEGAYYTWSWQAFTQALGEGSLRELAAARFGVSKEGNARSSPSELGNRNVLRQAKTVAELSEELDQPDQRIAERLDKAVARLREARRDRPSPSVDDKVVAAWNGYMITTLVRAAQTLDEPKYRDAALETAEFVWQHQVTDDSGRVYRSWREGQRGPEGTSADYAALAEAALALHRLTGQHRWQQRAEGLARAMLQRFWDKDNGALFARTDTAGWLRTKPFRDTPRPSANSQGARVMLALARSGEEPAWSNRAQMTAGWLAKRVEQSPQAASYMLVKWPDFREIGANGQ